MKKSAMIILVIAFTANLSFGQEKKKVNKEILIEKITSVLSPYNGRINDSDLSYSPELLEKYGIKSFEFHKINVLDGSDCNFTYSNGDGSIMPESLDVGDFYSHDIYNNDKTVYAKAKYKRFIRNEKNPIASQVEVVYYVYKLKK